MQVLGCLLSLLLIGFFVVLSIGMTIYLRIRQFFKGSNSTPQSSTTTSSPNNTEHKVLFGDDEGEYVDFEEVKE